MIGIGWELKKRTYPADESTRVDDQGSEDSELRVCCSAGGRASETSTERRIEQTWYAGKGVGDYECQLRYHGSSTVCCSIVVGPRHPSWPPRSRQFNSPKRLANRMPCPARRAHPSCPNLHKSSSSLITTTSPWPGPPPPAAPSPSPRANTLCPRTPCSSVTSSTLPSFSSNLVPC